MSKIRKSHCHRTVRWVSLSNKQFSLENVNVRYFRHSKGPLITSLTVYAVETSKVQLNRLHRSQMATSRENDGQTSRRDIYMRLLLPDVCWHRRMMQMQYGRLTARKNCTLSWQACIDRDTRCINNICFVVSWRVVRQSFKRSRVVHAWKFSCSR